MRIVEFIDDLLTILLVSGTMIKFILWLKSVDLMPIYRPTD